MEAGKPFFARVCPWTGGPTSPPLTKSPQVRTYGGENSNVLDPDRRLVALHCPTIAPRSYLEKKGAVDRAVWPLCIVIKEKGSFAAKHRLPPLSAQTSLQIARSPTAIYNNQFRACVRRRLQTCPGHETSGLCFR